MRSKNLSLLVVLVASIILGGCGNNEKEASSGTTNETNVDSKKDNKVAIEKPTIPSKSEEEIKEMVKKKLNDKVLKYHIRSGYYNDDKTLDFFITTNHLSPAEASYSNYFFYDSEADELKRVKVKKSSKLFNSIEVSAIEKGEIKGSGILLYEANDLGTFTKKTDVKFTIEDSFIVFDEESLSNIQKTDKKLSNQVDKEYEKFESEFPDR
jgi:hypothetical protein